MSGRETPIRVFVARRRNWLLAALALLLLYGGFGFIALPWLIRGQLERRGSAFLHREVTVRQVRVNPFVLSVTIGGLLVKDRDGRPFLSWEQLYLKAKLWPLVRKEARLGALRLVKFYLRAGLDHRGRLDFQDILDALPTDDGKAAAKSEGAPWVFGIDQLEIDRAEIAFTDLSHRRPFETRVGPITIELKDFRTRADATAPYSFSGTTESGESFSWAGRVLLDPLRSSGWFSFENLQLRKYSPYYEQAVGFEIRDGRLGVTSKYELEWGAARHLLKIADGTLSLRSLALLLPGSTSPVVELPEGQVTGISADLVGRDVVVESALLRGGVVRARRGPDGAIDLMAMARPAPGGAPPAVPAPQASQPAAKEEAEGEPPLRWLLRSLDLSGWRVELNDALPAPAVRMAVAPVDLRMTMLSSDRSSTATLQASARVEGRGEANVDGTVSIHGPSADLSVRVEGLDLMLANPYIPTDGKLDARLSGGRLSLSGRARYDGGHRPASWAFDGDVKVEGFALQDSARGQELARWRSLQLYGVRAASAPAGSSIRLVRWVEPRLEVQIARDGSSNLKRVLRAEGTRGTQPKAQAGGGLPPEPSPYPLSVASFQVVRGAGTFTDRSVKPPVSLGAEELEVRVRGLSNAVKARSQVMVRGVASGGTFEVDGTLSPRLVNDATNLKIVSRGIDLTPLSPFCGKYVGYLLEKGTLDLDLGYAVAKRKLQGQNHIQVDQLTLSDASTDSKEATSLPVKLGLAILRDRNGLIDLRVPVGGDIDDPTFRLGGVIWNAIVNVFTKVVTAPFTALARLAGATGNGRLDVVEFAPGSAEITPSASSSLQLLAKALVERPGLRVAIEPVSDPVADGRAFRMAELRRRAAAAAGRTPKGGSAAGGDVEPTDEETVRFVAAAYKALGTARGSPGKSGGAAEADPAEMEERVLESLPVPQDAFRTLEQRRAEAVRARLAANTGLDPARLSIVEPGARALEEGGSRVYFELR